MAWRLLLILVLAWPQALASAQPAQESREDRIKDLERRERGLIAQLDGLDRQISQARGRLREINAELDRLREEGIRSRSKAEEMRQAEKALRPRLAARLRALSRFGGEGVMGLFLAAESPSEAAFGLSALIRVIEFDLKLIQDYNNLQKDLAEAERARQRNLSRMEELRERLAGSEKDLLVRKRERAALLLGLDEEKQRFQAALAEMERLDQPLPDDLPGLDKGGQVSAAVRFEDVRGRLPWPVRGASKGQNLKKRPGILIPAPEGAEVKAVAPGQVVHAGWVKGYGQVIILDHGERYYTLYAHLIEAQVKPGQSVEAGQVLGRIGPVGLWKTGVYFEIRRRNQALDARPWLTSINQ